MSNDALRNILIPLHTEPSAVGLCQSDLPIVRMKRYLCMDQIDSGGVHVLLEVKP
jgi:hypothetical protein